MNSKQLAVQNQRIDQITRSHLIVGIDVAKDTHAAHATNYRGHVYSKRHLSFDNDGEGFERLQQWFENLQRKHQLGQVVIGMEPTGHYWWSLANWLIEKGFQVVCVNPATTHRNKENRDNCPSKSDPKDAVVIAECISRGFYYEYTKQEESFQRLRTLMANREYWVKKSVSLQNRITRWIDIYFPEFSSVFKEWDGKRAMATLKELPLPTDLVTCTVDEIITIWRKHMKRAGGGTGTQFAGRLIAQAKRSIGTQTALAEAKEDLKWLVEDYERVNERLVGFEQLIDDVLTDIPLANELRSIKGLGRIYTAAILAGAGDLNQYNHGDQALRKAGLNLAECRSGKRKGEIILSKRGDSTFRKYLFLATLNLIRENPFFKTMHEYNTQVRHMGKMRSVFKILRKFVRMLIGMVKSGEGFCPEKAQSGLAQAA